MKIPASMDEQIADIKDLDISYRILHPAAIIRDEYTSRNIRIPFSSLTSKYSNFLSTIIVEIELDADEQVEYLFKPKALSNYLYGTTEFWNDLLILNNAYSTSEFKPTTVKIYDPNKFKKYINEILILEDIV